MSQESQETDYRPSQAEASHVPGRADTVQDHVARDLERNIAEGSLAKIV